MVKTCCVYKSNNQFNASTKEKGISFFRFPKDKRKRRTWIKAVNRDEWTPNDHSWICSEHFVQGWHGDDPEDENYAPTLFSYKQTVVNKEREQRVQCDLDPLIEENNKLREEINSLREELKRHKWSVDRIKDDDASTRFYTGLPSFAVFLWLYNFLASKASRMTFWMGEVNTSTTDKMRTATSTLPLIDQLFAVLVRLKVELFVQDISDRFQISPTSFSICKGCSNSSTSTSLSMAVGTSESGMFHRWFIPANNCRQCIVNLIS
uniref:Uncharacterized protein LOC111099903 isoform X3 n=1 Tax=Crassostrea virginica TaxID=6565 RepID=A0A8B8AB37_CRAVI|nr:uncharacterized protein LOC111099903 isoform X3 [Crassostrea virginica]